MHKAFTVFALSSLLSLAACAEDAEGDSTNPDDDSADEGADDEVEDEGDDEGADVERDAGRRPMDGGGGRIDATVPPDEDKPDASQPDAGRSDAGRSDAGAPPSDRLKPKCVKKDSQVIVIGDSYINWISHSFPQDIVKESGQMWRMEAIGGTSLGSGGVGFIGDQYTSSIMRDPDAHTILMDGGGNDLLVADPAIDFGNQCKLSQAPMLEQCQTIIDKAIQAADDLLQKASADGIRDVVYFFYPHVPKGTLLGGENPNAMLDFALPQVREFCAGVEGKTGGKTRCTFIDMVPVFEGHDDWFVFGDIHPTSQGSAAMAKEIWRVMKNECIGQKSGADCCEE